MRLRDLEGLASGLRVSSRAVGGGEVDVSADGTSASGLNVLRRRGLDTSFVFLDVAESGLETLCRVDVSID